MVNATATASTPPEEAWNKIYGGASPDRGYSVQQTRDGGYIITGVTESYDSGGSDVWLIKVKVTDTTPPFVHVVYPNGREILTGTVTLNATANDSDGTVAKVEYLYSADNVNTNS
ncbi:MAG: Ig-like domain-containing protein [Methanosarcinales archaeon]